MLVAQETNAVTKGFCSNFIIKKKILIYKSVTNNWASLVAQRIPWTGEPARLCGVTKS